MTSTCCYSFNSVVLKHEERGRGYKKSVKDVGFGAGFFEVGGGDDVGKANSEVVGAADEDLFVDDLEGKGYEGINTK
jgi:hypothetical protein